MRMILIAKLKLIKKCATFSFPLMLSRERHIGNTIKKRNGKILPLKNEAGTHRAMVSCHVIWQDGRLTTSAPARLSSAYN